MNYDLIIIGAGPAGMSAAITAKERGLNCLVLDEQPRSGGQIYRNIGSQRLKKKEILGPEYQAGSAIFEQFERSGCDKKNGATVWQITPEGEVYYSSKGISCRAKANKVLLATGAQERPMPIPGWTLPGVMTAGAAQILLKSPGIAADGAVFAGCGPLLYLVAWQYLQAGLKVKAILDTSDRSNLPKAALQWQAMLAGRSYIVKGLKLIRDIKSAGIPLIKGVVAVEALGTRENGLSAVAYSSAAGKAKIETSHLFLHQGVIPQVNLAMASGCEHTWNESQLCWQPETDKWGQSSQSSLMIAGDGLGIGGAVAAAHRGKLAALQAACESNAITQAERNTLSQPAWKALKKELAFRPFIDTLYRPADQFRLPQNKDDTVCRCEEVRLGDIQSAVAQGCMGPNQLKSFTRCGMGPCQGRQCGSTVSELMSQLSHTSVQATGYYRLRAPVKPLNLSELAGLADE